MNNRLTEQAISLVMLPLLVSGKKIHSFVTFLHLVILQHHNFLYHCLKICKLDTLVFK